MADEAAFAAQEAQAAVEAQAQLIAERGDMFARAQAFRNQVVREHLQWWALNGDPANFEIQLLQAQNPQPHIYQVRRPLSNPAPPRPQP